MVGGQEGQGSGERILSKSVDPSGCKHPRIRLILGWSALGRLGSSEQQSPKPLIVSEKDLTEISIAELTTATIQQFANRIIRAVGISFWTVNAELALKVCLRRAF